MTTIPKPSGKVRWIVCGLLFAAVVLSYIDRLVLPTLKPDLQARYGWSESGYADLVGDLRALGAEIRLREA